MIKTCVLILCCPLINCVTFWKVKILVQNQLQEPWETAFILITSVPMTSQVPGVWKCSHQMWAWWMNKSLKIDRVFDIVEIRAWEMWEKNKKFIMIIIISQTIRDLCVSWYEACTLYFKIFVRPRQILLRILAESGVVEACGWIAPGSHIRPVILSKPSKQTGSSKK